MNQDFFKQVVEINKSYRNKDRKQLISDLVKGKKVLHVGFVDYPITNKSDNLHLFLSDYCTRLDGIDINISPELIELLTVPNGVIYNNWKDVPNDYDIIIVPEVIEHVDNVREFLEIFDNYDGDLLVSAPDASLLKHQFINDAQGNYIELVHPDHNCWYSPYTLKNVLNKYSKTRKVDSLYHTSNTLIAVSKKIGQ